MKYRIVDYKGRTIADDIEAPAFQKVLEEGEGMYGDLIVGTELPINLEAILSRERRNDERVELRSGDKLVKLKRHTVDQSDGELSVSCSPEGTRVPIETLNISFRSIDDQFTDRGIAWVFPGTPASAQFVLNAKELKAQPDNFVVDIVAGFEQALQEQLLCRFA